MANGKNKIFFAKNKSEIGKRKIFFAGGKRQLAKEKVKLAREKVRMVEAKARSVKKAAEPRGIKGSVRKSRAFPLGEGRPGRAGGDRREIPASPGKGPLYPGFRLRLHAGLLNLSPSATGTRRQSLPEVENALGRASPSAHHLGIARFQGDK